MNMQTPNSDPGSELALQACHSCKSRKRKCDKTLPRCSACANRGQRCEYPRQEADTPSKASSSAEQAWYSSLLTEVHQPENRGLDFATILFLDPSLVQHGQVDTYSRTLAVPLHILQLIGELDEIRSTAHTLFEHTHKWMPFISKKRYYDVYLQPGYPNRPDVVMLFLAVRLITTVPMASESSSRNALYYAAKHFYTGVEGVFSIQVLQAGVLIALYELGHGIYPAAYLTIGACARYAQALGINFGSGNTVPTRRVFTLVEVEERWRVWWAIIILDRFVSIGCPGRPFATPDPRMEDPLPADDASWDQGTVRLEDFSTLSSPMPNNMSRFSLLCQAAQLLGQVLHHRANDASTHNDQTWAQLERTLESMLTVAMDINDPDHDQIAFIYSALVALHTPWLNPVQSRGTASERWQGAQVVLAQITDRINANLVERQCFLGRDPEDMSPWGLYFAYKICGNLMCVPQKTQPALTIIKSLQEGFRAINVRWKVAGAYLRLLEARQVTHLEGSA